MSDLKEILQKSRESQGETWSREGASVGGVGLVRNPRPRCLWCGLQKAKWAGAETHLEAAEVEHEPANLDPAAVDLSLKPERNDFGLGEPGEAVHGSRRSGTVMGH